MIKNTLKPLEYKFRRLFLWKSGPDSGLKIISYFYEIYFGEISHEEVEKHRPALSSIFPHPLSGNP